MMPKKPTLRNSFEALCTLASKEGWCWKIGCLTCAHMYFRYGFMELSRGKHPDVSNWIVSNSRRDELHAKLGPVWNDSQGPSASEQYELIAILSDASLSKIAKRCRFPSWLGYLGLALNYTEKVEAQTRVLTKSWTPQLLDMLPKNADSMHLMKLCLFDNSEAPLRWGDLVSMKEALLIGARIQDNPSISFAVH